MALLSLDETEGLTGLVSRATFRTEDISALWLQNNGGTLGPVIVLLKSGETVPLDTASGAATEALYAKIKGAL
jgi:hypothetical protein